MVVNLNRTATAAAETKAVKPVKVAPIGTFTNMSDFEKVGKEIASGVPGYKQLLQNASVAAVIHLDKHGNFNVIRPLWEAAKTFSAGEGRKWFDWIISHTFLEYNPNKLRGNALAEAGFESLFKKNKAKKMDLDGAKKNAWFDHVKARPSVGAQSVNLSKMVDTMLARLSKLLAANALYVPTSDGKGVAKKATAADVRSELKHKLEAIVSQPLKVVGGTASKPAPSAKKATARKASKVAKPAKAKAA
jgi:hypothetical protein